MIACRDLVRYWLSDLLRPSQGDDDEDPNNRRYEHLDRAPAQHDRAGLRCLTSGFSDPFKKRHMN
jgi:hypothetical protein